METFVIICSILLFMDSIALFTAIRIIKELNERNIDEIKYSEKLSKKLQEEQKNNETLRKLYNKLTLKD